MSFGLGIDSYGSSALRLTTVLGSSNIVISFNVKSHHTHASLALEENVVSRYGRNALAAAVCTASMMLLLYRHLLTWFRTVPDEQAISYMPAMFRRLRPSFHLCSLGRALACSEVLPGSVIAATHPWSHPMHRNELPMDYRRSPPHFTSRAMWLNNYTGARWDIANMFNIDRRWFGLQKARLESEFSTVTMVSDGSYDSNLAGTSTTLVKPLLVRI